MKKLIVAAFAVALAAAAQAATAKWSANNIYMHGTSDKAAGVAVYFIQSSAFSLADATAALAASDISFLSKATDGASGVTSSTGVANISGWGDFGNSEKITGYCVILDAATVEGASYAFISPEASGTTGVSGQAASIAFGRFDGTGTAPDTRDVANWYALAPEPTSGLMMLLGMGVLALRRRRA